MSLIVIILIAAGLSMDAFAVSVTLGLSVKRLSVRHYLLPGLYFGFFQAFMPLVGYFAGVSFADGVESVSHWVAFALLGLIGGKMIAESFSKDKGDDDNTAGKQDPFRASRMLLLAVATSIDALAVGVTIALFKINIFTAIAIIGAITFAVSIAGVKIGNIFGSKFKSRAEFLGGAVLAALGVKILIEHFAQVPR